MSSHDETQAPSERWSEIRDRHVIFENDHALVLNKLAGTSVTGERHGWDIVSLADAAGEWIMPAHRIDKVTSGAVLFAKTIEAHGGLTRQFNRRTVDKGYLAITRTVGLPESGIIDLPLSEGRKKRVRVAAPRERIVADTSSHTWSVPRSEVFDNKRSYPSVSLFVRLWEGRRHTLLLVRPVTGRRHQIRVHLSFLGYPIAGDPVYGGGRERALSDAPSVAVRQALIKLNRQALHAETLAFNHPDTDERLEFSAPMPSDMQRVVDSLRSRG